MKIQVILFMTFILMMTINACVTPDAVMKKYLGHKINEVILNEGPANDVQPDGTGGMVYTWYYRRTSYIASRTFLCDDKGVIYAYRWKGL